MSEFDLSQLSNEKLLQETSNQLISHGELSELRNELVKRLSLVDVLKNNNDFLRSELKALIAKLEISEKNKTEFLANIKNQLNNPLNTILILTEHLMQKFSNERNVISNLKLLYESAINLNFGLTNLIAASELESGDNALSCSNFKLSDLINESVSLFASKINQKNLKVEVKCSPSIKVYTDRSKLLLAIENLISNAVEFNNENGHISIIASDKKREVDITVSDTGVGFLEEDEKVIFLRFKQLESGPRRDYVSSGLGLSLVKDIADILESKLNFSSKLGEGSSFTFSIKKNALGINSLAFDEDGFLFDSDRRNVAEY